MARLLCVQANPKPVEESKCLTMARAFLEVYQEVNPKDWIEIVDVYRDGVPIIDFEVTCGWGKLCRREAPTEAEMAKIQAIGAFTEQFLAADKYVFVTPMWNLSVPPLMKAYIDTIVVAGKTFQYTEKGPVGLVENKKAIHLHARGGSYSQPPMTEFDFADRYLRGILGFLGVRDYQAVICEGHEYAPDHAAAILEAAVAKAREAARTF